MRFRVIPPSVECGSTLLSLGSLLSTFGSTSILASACCSYQLRVSTSKILGMHISEDHKWNVHIHYVFKKANKWLYAIWLLKKAGVATEDLVENYCSLLRSFLEYAAPVWLYLPDYLASVIESIQKKALKIILPMYDYAEPMNVTGLECLSLRRPS